MHSTTRLILSVPVDPVSSTRFFQMAESLGGMKSLVRYRAAMTHKTIPVDKQRASGVATSLIRLSLGLEEPEDHVAALEEAFSKLQAKISRPLTNPLYFKQ
jgi:cysteine-S-conjugate beta-lyase